MKVVPIHALPARLSFGASASPFWLSLGVIAALGACTTDTSLRIADSGAQPGAAAVEYPAPERQNVVDDYHGTKIADPYRGLEDTDAPATRRWIEAENALTHSWIATIPERAEIERRMTELWNYERNGVPFKKGGKYFWFKNDGLQNQAVLYVANTIEGAPRALLDPNALRKDGTVAVAGQRVSQDGRYLAYQLSEAGSDWTTIRVRDVASGKDLDDKIEWVKFSGLSWTPDSKGFFYSTFPDHTTKSLANHTLKHHTLGTGAGDDTVVYARPDHPQWSLGGWVTDDGELLVVTQNEGTEQKTRVFTKDLRDAASPIVPLFDLFDAEYEFLGKKHERLWFRTDSGAANSRIVTVDLGQTKTNAFTEVVPEAREAVEHVLLAGDRLIVTYLKDAANETRVFELDGKRSDTLKLPGLGSVAQFEGDQDDPETFFAFTSFTTPTQVWRYDVAKKAASLWRAPKVAFSPDDYVTEQVFYPSKDKTRVPMFVTHRKDVHLGPSTPTLLYGYGGFNIAMKPSFSPAILVWMERGGTYAVANLRGGAEYGREWHEAGTQAKKQNVFDDFISAAEYLIAKGWTSTPKLAIHGRSNGGLLVGACMTQRPDLFGAAIPGVGVLDMLRYHEFTGGWMWASDYGRSDRPTDFAYLVRYSPLHNIKPGTRYPPTLITTGDHDDRVVPGHSFKFAATLQRAQAGPDPILIRIETRGGHGAGKPTSMQIEELSDEFAFLTRALHLGRPIVDG
jgi:prolyl oligopeptidase